MLPIIQLGQTVGGLISDAGFADQWLEDDVARYQARFVGDWERFLTGDSA